MIVAPVPDHVRQKRWRDWEAKRIAQGERKHENRVRNRELLLRIEHGRRKTEFRGRHYGVPPVPWEPAHLMFDAQLRFAALQRQAESYQQDHTDNVPPDPEEWTAVYLTVAAAFKKACHPLGWRRLFWRFLPSPVLGASPSEVGRILNFFSECQRADAIESLIREARDQAQPGTSPEASIDSSNAIPASANGDGTARYARSRGKRSLRGSR